MSVIHSVNPSQHLVVSDFSGKITLNEIAAACTKLRHHPEFEPSFRQLADFSGVDAFDLRPDDLKAIRSLYDPFSKKSKRAFIAADPATRRTVTAYQTISENPELLIYDSTLDAIASLGLEAMILRVGRAHTSCKPGPEGKASLLMVDIPDATSTRRSITPQKKAHKKGH
jgi:hypothetical protein